VSPKFKKLKIQIAQNQSGNNKLDVGERRVIAVLCSRSKYN
jgi:hypothetical protein